uniref:DUF5009 domain-containing protein n=1 Tax=Solanum lycopersicum TaxID=4081 RepID=A0A3Q7H2D1_SOLLC
MSSLTVVTDSGERAPLLCISSPELSHSHPRDGEIVSSSSDEIAVSKPTLSDPKQRLVSLDVFRGLTIAFNLLPSHLSFLYVLMILVDDAGKAFPSINHSPWFGVTLADFVMPFFLFIVGVSASLVFKKVSCKPQATKKVLLRTVKLFILGVVLQGGYFHGRNNLSYGVDIAKIRWMGVLQRISIGYLFASILEIWFANDYPVDSSKAFIRRYFFQALAGMLIGLSYLILVYGLYVPDWFFEISSLNMESRSPVSGYRLSTQTVNCGVRGSLEPPCNVVGLIDRLLLGEKHLYQRPVYRRTKECSVNSPDYGPPPSNAPGWCLAPFDPEGILRITGRGICIGACRMNNEQDAQEKPPEMSIDDINILYLILLNEKVTARVYKRSVRANTRIVNIIFIVDSFVEEKDDITDLRHGIDLRSLSGRCRLMSNWMGMNALILYAMAACDLFSGAVQGFYWYSPENNLVDITERFIQAAFNSKKWGTLVFVMLEILIWGLVAGFLHAKKVYIKL